MQLTREIFSFSKKNTQVYITPNWIDLSKDESSIQLLDDEKEKYVALKSEKRKKEFLLIRFLRNNFFPGKEIAYTETGAPYFKDKSCSISISHSSTFIALAATSEERIGIDIELIQDKIIKLGHKFMHLDEIARVNPSNEVIQYTSFWCAKEALYKWSNIRGLSFQNDLAIHCDASGNWHGKSTRISTNLIPLETLEFNNHILCFTYSENDSQRFRAMSGIPFHVFEVFDNFSYEVYKKCKQGINVNNNAVRIIKNRDFTYGHRRQKGYYNISRKRLFLKN